MAAVPQQQQSTGMTAAQFAYLLWQQQQASGEAGDASAAARGLSQNYTDRANAQINTGDAYYEMLKALQGQLMTTTGQDEGDLKNRTDQIASGLNGTVDRAAAIAGSQAGAQLRKRGMGDSTQAAESANGLTRQYGEVYQKIQEMARQRAFDELKSKQGLNQQLLGTVGTGLSSSNNSSLTNAREMSTAASKAASEARQNQGGKTQNLLESKLMEAMLGSKAVKGGIDDGMNYLGDKVKSLFAPAAFDPEAFYSAPKETANYADWKASEQAANGVTQSSALPISEMLDPSVLGTQEPVWFNQYEAPTVSGSGMVGAPTAVEQPASFAVPTLGQTAQPQQEQQQWYTLPEYSDQSFTDQYQDYTFSNDLPADQNYFDDTAYTWEAPQEEQTWEVDYETPQNLTWSW